MALEAFPIHDAAALGDAGLLDRRVREVRHNVAAEIERFNREGLTALMCAVMSPHADSAIVRTLIERGASVHRVSEDPVEWNTTVITLALRAGDPEKVAEIVRAGANLRYEREGYTAAIDCVHGRNVRADRRLLDLLRYLISEGVDLNAESKYSETALRVLSRLGRFDAIKLLVEAGADESQLRWDPLHQAIAYGDIENVRALLNAGANLETRDFWERTPLLLAIVSGNLPLAKLLLESGADIEARGRCARPALFYAVEAGDRELFDWLLRVGANVSATDQFDRTALVEACDHDFAGAVELLLAAGADVNAKAGAGVAIASTRSPEITRRLLAAGADIAEITTESRRTLLGLSPNPDVGCLTVTAEEFLRGAPRRFGKSNPEAMDEPFWIAMIRAGVNAWQACELFREVDVANPVWCAERFGQSITFLPDGRIVQIGGEHEDSYDADFCIYNDVFVHDGASIRIHGFPEKVFPPTDFHTATLLGNEIWLIGSLGYHGKRQTGTTPIYLLDVRSFEIRRVHAFGTGPGWIYKHRAALHANGEIVVSGGMVAAQVNGKEEQVANEAQYVLETTTLRWKVVPGEGSRG